MNAKVHQELDSGGDLDSIGKNVKMLDFSPQDPWQGHSQIGRSSGATTVLKSLKMVLQICHTFHSILLFFQKHLTLNNNNAKVKHV
jgi:hypothetical protein